MSEGYEVLVAATALFVGGHFLLSSRALRVPLVRALGPSGFQLAYSALAAVSLVWMIAAYRAAPYIELWAAPPALAWLPILVMPFALILAVAGVTTPSPTMVGAERMVADERPDLPTHGIMTITRHPFLWGVALWAGSHIPVNGDIASLIFLGGLLALSLGGMRHIDQRRASALGAAWGPVELTTSTLPFAAIASGRATLDLPGIGWWRPVVALGLYVVLLHVHGPLIGVSPLPG